MPQPEAQPITMKHGLHQGTVSGGGTTAVMSRHDLFCMKFTTW